MRKYTSTPEGAKARAMNLTKTEVHKVEMPENQKYIAHMMEIQRISQKADVENLDTLKQCFLEYLELCAKNNMKVGNMGAYAAMGISKYMAFDWEHGRKRQGNKEYQQFITFVKMMIAAYRESAIAEGDINPIVGIFWQKSFDGLNEMTEAEASNMLEGVSTEVTDGKQIADKYQGLLPE